LQLLIPWELGDYNIQTSKFYFFNVVFNYLWTKKGP
jgi:hypothetical protein